MSDTATKQKPLTRAELAAERRHLAWVRTLSASDMDGLSAVNLVGRAWRLLLEVERLRGTA